MGDLRYALRALRRNPGLTLVCVLTISLGVGATTAVSSIVNALLFRPLPITAPGRVVSVEELRRGAVGTMLGRRAIPYERYEQYRDATARVFSGLAANHYASFSLQADGEATSIYGSLTSANYFDVLGVRPAAGHFFARDDERTVVLSHALWRSRFGADPGVVGRTVHLDSRPYTVVGVAARGFSGTNVGFVLDAWVPIRAYAPGAGASMFDRWVAMFGRLAPGVTLAQASAAANVAATSIPPGERQTVVERARVTRMSGIPSGFRGDVDAFLGILFGTALLVLLIAGANVAGILLARAAGRRREMGVRVAIGAGRGRIVRQLLVESVVLFLVGGGAGVGVAYLLTGLLERVAVLPMGFAVALDVSPDPAVIVGALLIAAVVGIAFGLVPALDASRTDVTRILKEADPRGGRSRARSAFVAAQFALCVLLLVVGGLFVRTLRSALGASPGFDPDGVVVAGIDLAPHGIDEERGRAFYARLLERVRALPEVQAAGIAQVALLTGSRYGSDVHPAEGGPAGERRTNAGFDVVDPAYFETLRVSLTAGRFFTPGDRAGTRPVAVVNETLARRMWPGEDPLGRRLRIDRDEAVEVVGVTRDGKYASQEEDPQAFVFLPFAQRYAPDMVLHVRTRAPAPETVSKLREVVHELNPNVALQAPGALAPKVGVTLLPQRVAAWLIGGFGLVGMLLAALGVYGLLSYLVTQRSREFGIRIALGAREQDLVRQVLGSGARIAAAGALIGIAGAILAAHLVHAFAFGVSPLDPVTFLAVPALLAAVALLACWLPARRAAGADPVNALRAE